MVVAVVLGLRTVVAMAVVVAVVLGVVMVVAVVAALVVGGCGYTVLCTLYSPRSHRMYPHTQYVRHCAQVSILALYTVTLHAL